MSLKTGKIVAVDPVKNLIQVAIDQTGFVGWYDGPSIGNNTNGIQWGPSVGDVVYLDEVSGFTLITQAVADQNHKQTLLEGQWIFFNAAGCQIYLDPSGAIRISPSKDGLVTIGNILSGPIHAVVRDGDTVTGIDSHGDTFTGVVHASSVRLFST